MDRWAKNAVMQKFLSQKDTHILCTTISQYYCRTTCRVQVEDWRITKHQHAHKKYNKNDKITYAYTLVSSAHLQPCLEVNSIE